MRQLLLMTILLWACWIQCRTCMPVSEILNRNVAFAKKYGWSEEAMGLISKGLKIPGSTYTDEQARKFVANGLLYLERDMLHGEEFDKLGNEGKHVSRSFVYGIDDVPNGAVKPRWRWLPLIDDFDGQNLPIYHTSTWSDGTSTKSMDVLRVDYYFSHHSRYFVPAAIIRPIQKKGGFGQGLRFNTAYEFSASFSHFKRNPVLASAKKVDVAIRKDFDQWFALVSSQNREMVDEHYKKLSGRKIYRQQSAIISKLLKLRNKDDTPTPESPEAQEGIGAAEVHSDDSRQVSEPNSPESPFTPWDGREIANTHNLDNAHGQASTWMAPSFYDSHGASSSTSSPNVPHVDALLPQHLLPMQVSGRNPWFDTNMMHPEELQPGTTAAAGSTHPERLGFARWRRPTPSWPEPPDSQ